MPASPLLPTTPLFHCPQCRAPVRAGDISCRACGVNLALAAVLTERQVLVTMPTAGPPRTADVPRFGEFLVNHGYITTTQLEAGLTRQREAAAIGARNTIGQTLIEMGALTREQLELASIQQTKQLQSALEESNRQLEQRVAERTQELQKALDKLTELEELKANFVSNVSHELLTPLAPITGYSELLTQGALGPLNNPQLDAIQAIRRGGERLGELINELIQFAASLTGKMRLNLTIISVPDLAKPLQEYFEPKAVAGGVRLRLDLPDSLPRVSADGEKIYWVLFQLVDNAIKFTPASGEVILTAEARANRLRVSVLDTGVGIPLERLGEMFRPFHQVLGPLSQPVDGTGLGLALVKRIVEAHDSKVEVESQPGRGSTFAFELPIATPP